RTESIAALYFGGSEGHDIADYTWYGPGRLNGKVFGNGANLEVSYDGKRRISDYTWRDDQMTPELLVGFTYGYDDVDNPLYEQFKHDNDYYDNYQYDDQYRLTGVRYRDSSS